MATDPDTLVDLTTARSEFEASIMIGVLKDRGIPAFTFSHAGMTLQWEVAGSLPFRVCVRKADLDRARDALREARSDSVDIDWNEVAVGPPPDGNVSKQLDDEPRPFVLEWLTRWGLAVLAVGMALWAVWVASGRLF
ncbi:MAG: DUF2007 domain-containing protein [Phycisphaerales bacterium]|nr:DUF2007 domain-containing protein [Phycisphaerales bacterium]